MFLYTLYRVHSIKHKCSVHKAGRAHGAITRQAVQPVSRAAWDLGKIHGDGTRSQALTFDPSLVISTKVRQIHFQGPADPGVTPRMKESTQVTVSQLQQPALTQSWCRTANKITFVSAVGLDNYLIVAIRKLDENEVKNLDLVKIYFGVTLDKYLIFKMWTNNWRKGSSMSTIHCKWSNSEW